jgi:hypothetical protein
MNTNKIFFVLIFLITSYLSSQSPAFGIGETTGSILRIPIGARQIALGEAFVSIADDVNTIYYNPAGINNVKGQEISFMYHKGLTDINNGLLAYGRQTKFSSIGGSILYLDAGEIELNYPDRPSETRRAQQDFLLTLCYGRKRLWFLGKFGLNLKIFHSTLVEEVKTTAVAIDLGLLTNLNLFKRSFSIGIVTQNFGPDVTYEGGLASGKVYEHLPWLIKSGVSTEIKIREKNALTPVLDISCSIFEKIFYINTGIEYSYQDKFFGRVGYRGQYGLSGFTFGFGFRQMKYQVDYGLAYMGNLGLTHYLSFGMRL